MKDVSEDFFNASILQSELLDHMSCLDPRCFTIPLIPLLFDLKVLLFYLESQALNNKHTKIKIVPSTVKAKTEC